MKSIQNVSVWFNGEEKQANILTASIIADDMATSATFYYQLMESSLDAENNIVVGQGLAAGNVTMAAEDYQNWDDSNDSAYQYIAQKLNLVIV
jgi:hypothetical protein